MDEQAIRRAAEAIARAWAEGRRIEALPEGARPGSLAEAHAIQDAAARLLGLEVGGWKVALVDGEVMRGAIFCSRILASPAHLPAARVPLLGVEAEITFRRERDLPARTEAHAEAEVLAAVQALVAIEVVDSRFTSYQDTPLLDRAADFVSDGALVPGTAPASRAAADLAGLEAVLTVDGREVVRRRGRHAAGGPVGPTVALANALRTQGGLRAGQIVTAGTYTGLEFVRPGQRVAATFPGLGAAEVEFVA